MKKDFDKIRFYYFFGLLVVFSLLLFWVLSPFVNSIIWAAVLAWFFYPLYRAIHRHFILNKSAAAFITITLIIMLVLLPLIGLASLILQQTIGLYHSTEKEVGDIIGKIRLTLSNYQDYSAVKTLDYIGFDIQGEATKALQLISQFISSQIAGLTRGTITFFVGLLIMMYTLFYFFQDGERFLKILLRISPLDDKNDELIYKNFTSTLRATFKGSILVSLIQGVLAGLIFWISGVTAPLFWALIMVVLAILPAVGPGILALPAGIILLLMGRVWQGVFMLVVGVGVVSVIDNILRPYLVGKDAEIHPLLIFFSIIGGMAIFGATGFIIGPVVASIAATLFGMYIKHYKKELGK